MGEQPRNLHSGGAHACPADSCQFDRRRHRYPPLDHLIKRTTRQVLWRRPSFPLNAIHLFRAMARRDLKSVSVALVGRRPTSL